MNDSTSTRTLNEGDFVAWYRIERVLGQGGFGITYLATDTNLDHLVALKEYLPSSLVRRAPDKTISPITDRSEHEYKHGLDSFLREARTLVKFRHPNIVRVMSVFEANSSAYLVMEYERGVEFRDYVKQHRPIDEVTLIDLFLDIIDGLDQVHQTGYLHRDIKPVNLIIRDDGSPVLLDFGSSRRVDVGGENTSFVSAGYTALEQYRAGSSLEVGPWTDIYALGGTLYYAITGESPVSPISRLAAHVRGADDPLRPAVDVGEGGYSEAFLDTVDWALAFQTSDRPATLAAWRERLQQARDQHDASPAAIARPAPGQAQSSARDIEPDLAAPKFAPSEFAAPEAAAPATAQSGTQGTAQSAVKNSSKSSAKNSSKSSSTNSANGAGNNADPRSRRLLTKERQAASGQAAGAQPAKLSMRRTGLWLGLLAIVGLAALFGTIRYRDFQAEQLLNNRIAQAESNLRANEVPVSAIVDLRDVLQTHPDSERARRGVQQGIAKIQQRATAQINNLEIDAATETIKTLESLGVRSDALQRQLEEVTVNQSVQRQIDSIVRLTASGSYDQAIEQIRATREIRDDTRLDALEQSAMAGIERIEAERRDAEEQRRRTQARIAEANKRQRARRESYNSYLSSVDSALGRGDVESARRWLESARALQIDDQALVNLERRVTLAEEFASKPLSDYELRYAAGRFNALKEAVEGKNRSLIAQLSEGEPSRLAFVERLFERYSQISMEVVDVQSQLSPRRATANLRIESLALSNGDIVYPAESYRVFPLQLRRDRYSWSRIEW